MKGDKMFFLSIVTFAVGEFSLLIAKESMKFNIGIDLISIAAAVVSISAIIMALTINYSDRIYQPTMEHVPYKIRMKMENISIQIKSVSEQLDLDNRHSQGLKKNIIGVMIGALASLFIIFGWRKISELISGSVSGTVMISGCILAYILIVISLFYMLFKSKKVSRSLSDIITNATNSRNIAQSRKVVSLVTSIAEIITVILLFPFIMFMFNMHKIYMLIPLALVILLIIQVHRFSKEAGEQVTDNYTTDKSFGYQFKHDWKI
jgi:hypothetical protein